MADQTTEDDAVVHELEAVPAPKVSFAEWLAGHRGGALNDLLTLELAEIAQSVQLEGKNGKLQLSITLKPESNGVVVVEDVKATPPKPNPSSFCFVDEDGSLTTRDPKQPQLPGVGD
ncbi:MAG: hypothetical protein AAGA42_02400 [Actinomycetota bacterium]